MKNLSRRKIQSTSRWSNINNNLLYIFIAVVTPVKGYDARVITRMFLEGLLIRSGGLSLLYRRRCRRKHRPLLFSGRVPDQMVGIEASHGDPTSVSRVNYPRIGNRVMSILWMCVYTHRPICHIQVTFDLIKSFYEVIRQRYKTYLRRICVNARNSHSDFIFLSIFP